MSTVKPLKLCRKCGKNYCLSGYCSFCREKDATRATVAAREVMDRAADKRKGATDLEAELKNIPVFKDAEMQEAIMELRQAESMFDNARNPYRMDEAGFRIEAAKKRIEAIRHERGDLFVEALVGEPQKKQAIQA